MGPRQYHGGVQRLKLPKVPEFDWIFGSKETINSRVKSAKIVSNSKKSKNPVIFALKVTCL